MIVGLITAFHVVKKAWVLLEDPASIAEFAAEIERQTHINLAISRMPSMKEMLNPMQGASPAIITLPPGLKLPNGQQIEGMLPPVDSNQAGSPSKEAGARKEVSLNAAYFAAWALQLMVLGLIARIALWAVSEGGRLAISRTDQEQMLQRIFRELIRESRASSR